MNSTKIFQDHGQSTYPLKKKKRKKDENNRDLNTKVGKKVGSESTYGEHGIGARSKSGEIMSDVSKNNSSFIINSSLCKGLVKKSLWLSLFANRKRNRFHNFKQIQHW